MRLIKAGETSPTLLYVIFDDIRLLDNISPALNEVGGQPQLSINGGTFSNNGISILTAIGFGKYYASLNTDYVLVPGDIIIPRYKGVTTLESRSETIQIVDSATYTAPQSATPLQYYGSITNAKTFFSQRLRTNAWDEATDNDKIKSLIMATQAIDRLNFDGQKTDETQILQFPRKNINFLFPTLSFAGEPDNNLLNPLAYVDDSSLNNPVIKSTNYGLYLTTTDIIIPNDIEVATYLCAIKFLDDYDPDIEILNLSATSNRTGGVSTNYDRSFVPDHIKAGIPSIEAWNYLRPYLRDFRSIQLIRQT